ncbi:MAG TPA: M14 metallopeptidase family protein [Sphingobacteriaceae bacterium]|nr:M14 metallopeptidase family protein [Sphingobacteriaceae bacterium]
MGDDYKLATYTQTEAYFKNLASKSDRVKLVDIGKTEEGRSQYMLVVSSPDNLKSLLRYKKISQQLAQAEGLTAVQAQELAKEGKAIVWIDGGLHATETLGATQLIETAYQLTTRNDPETMRILNDVVILLTHANPDGMELVTNWYMREKVPEKRSLQYLPRLYQKYAGHDNNRDFFMLNLKETQNIANQLFIEWLPQIMYNHHQAGPPGSIVAGAPYRDPFNYVFDPILMTSIDALGAALNTRLNAENKPGYTQKYGSVYSTWYNGGLRTTTYFHNIIGLLTETVGGPNPTEIPLVPHRLIPNGGTTFPVTPQKWHFRQSVDYSVSMNYAVLNYAQRYRDELLNNMYLMGKNSIDKGNRDSWSLSPKRVEAIYKAYQTDLKNNKTIASATTLRGTLPSKYFDTVMRDPELRDPRGYILPSDQPDFPTAVKFVNALTRTGVIAHQSTADFTLEGKKYPSGSYIIRTNQAFRPHVLDMFEPQDHPNDFKYDGGPPIAPYDAAGWTLAYLMNVKFDRIMDDFNGLFKRISNTTLQAIEPNSLSSALGFTMHAQSNNAFAAVNKLLQAGQKAYRINGGDERGTYFIPGTAKAKAVITELDQDSRVVTKGITKKPKNLLELSPLRVGLWDNYGGSMPSGWIRFLMEQYHFNVTRVYAQEIDAGNLNEKFDVIILPSGAISAYNAQPALLHAVTTPKPEDVPNEYRSQLGSITQQKSVSQLKKFMDLGGKVVAIGSSANLAYHLKLPVRDALVEMSVNGEEKKLSTEKFYVPGSVLSVSVDNLNPAAWGMENKADVYFDNSPVFKISPEASAKGIIKPLAWFSTSTPLRSGWAWGQNYLLDGVTAFEAPIGKGKLLVFGPEITFRAQTHGTFKLLFNQLYK